MYLVATFDGCRLDGRKIHVKRKPEMPNRVSLSAPCLDATQHPTQTGISSQPRPLSFLPSGPCSFTPACHHHQPGTPGDNSVCSRCGCAIIRTRNLEISHYGDTKALEYHISRCMQIGANESVILITKILTEEQDILKSMALH